jgi:hypothetical protein
MIAKLPAVGFTWLAAGHLQISKHHPVALAILLFKQ